MALSAERKALRELNRRFSQINADWESQSAMRKKEDSPRGISFPQKRYLFIHGIISRGERKGAKDAKSRETREYFSLRLSIFGRKNLLPSFC